MASKAFTIPTIFTAVDNMSATIAGIHKSMQNFANRTNVGLARAERGFRSLISPITAVNRLLGGFGIFIGGYTIYRTISGLIDIFSNFQQANANLAAIMGITVQKNIALSNSAKQLGLTTSKTATEVVGLQIELAKLGFTQEQILNMSRAIVQGSVALDASLDRTALLTGAMTRTFQNFSKTGSDTQHIMDVMALAANDTALDFKKLETGLPIVGGAANAVGLSFEKTVALLGALSNAGIDASMSATALRNILIDSRRKGHTYDQVLGNIARHVDTLTPAFDKFGRRTAVSAQILVQNLKAVQTESERLTKVQSGYVDLIANKRLDTYIGSVTLLKAAYQGLVLSIEDGTNGYSKFLTNLNKTARALLLILTNTPAAREELVRMNNDIVDQAQTWLTWLKVIGWVTASLVALKAALIGWGVITAIFRTLVYLTIAWNAGLITATGTILGLSAAIVGSAAGALYILIAAIQSVQTNFNDMISSFSNGNIFEGLKKYANIFIDIFLYPMQKMAELLDKLGLVKNSGWFKELRKELGIKFQTDVTKPLTNFTNAPMPGKAMEPYSFKADQLPAEYRQLADPNYVRQQMLIQKMESTQRQETTINLKAPNGWGANVENNNNMIPIKISSTMSPWE